MPTVPEKSASERLGLDRKLYEVFEKIQSCAHSLQKEVYVFGCILHELLSRNKNYNASKLIEIIFVSDFVDVSSTMSRFFEECQLIYSHEKIQSYRIQEGYNLVFYFLPDFSCNTVNVSYGFTIDQIYYHIKDNKLIDPTGRGLSDFLEVPIKIKTTSAVFDKKLLQIALSKVGTYISEIDKQDFLSLSSIKIDRLDNISLFLWLNRPGYVLETLIKMFPSARLWVFNSILKSLLEWKISLQENICPSKVLSAEKLKLLDMYSDYFNESGSAHEKSNKAKLLAKMLVDL